MRIRELVWPHDRVQHIATHGVRPHEVEEVCFGSPLVFRGKSGGQNPVYHVLGQTSSGRHLFCVVIGLPDARGCPVTARPMTQREKRRYTVWRRQRP